MRRQRFRIVPICISLTAIIGYLIHEIAPSAAQDGPPMNKEQIIELLSGNTIKGSGYKIYYAPDGTHRGKEGSYRDTGAWTVFDDHYCVRWKKWAQGQELCWELRRDGNTVYRKGLVNAGDNKVTWVQGNPEGL